MPANLLKYFAGVRYVFPCFHEPNLSFTEVGVNYNKLGANKMAAPKNSYSLGNTSDEVLHLLKLYIYLKKTHNRWCFSVKFTKFFKKVF